MRQTVSLLLDLDTRNWIDTVRSNLQRQRQQAVTTSEAVEYICKSHYTKKMRQVADQKHADRVGDKLKGSAVIKPPSSAKKNLPKLW